MAHRFETRSLGLRSLVFATATLCGATVAEAAGMALRSPEGVVTPYVFNFKRPTILVPLVPSADNRPLVDEAGAADARGLAVQAALAARRKPAPPAGVGSESVVPRGTPAADEPQTLVAMPRTAVQVSVLEPPASVSVPEPPASVSEPPEERGAAPQHVVQLAALPDGTAEAGPSEGVAVSEPVSPVGVAEVEAPPTEVVTAATSSGVSAAVDRALVPAPEERSHLEGLASADPAGLDETVRPAATLPLDAAPPDGAGLGQQTTNPSILLAVAPAALVVLTIFLIGRRRARKPSQPSARGAALLCEPESCRRLVRLLSRTGGGAPARPA